MQNNRGEQKKLLLSVAHCGPQVCVSKVDTWFRLPTCLRIVGCNGGVVGWVDGGGSRRGCLGCLVFRLSGFADWSRDWSRDWRKQPQRRTVT